MAISAIGNHDGIDFCGRTYDVTSDAGGVTAVRQVAPASANGGWTPGSQITPEIRAVIAASGTRATRVDITA